MPTCCWSPARCRATWSSRCAAPTKRRRSPKLVVAVGDCGCTGGIFGESYASLRPRRERDSGRRRPRLPAAAGRDPAGAARGRVGGGARAGCGSTRRRAADVAADAPAAARAVLRRATRRPDARELRRTLAGRRRGAEPNPGRAAQPVPRHDTLVPAALRRRGAVRRHRRPRRQDDLPRARRAACGRGRAADRRRQPRADERRPLSLARASERHAAAEPTSPARCRHSRRTCARSPAISRTARSTRRSGTRSARARRRSTTSRFRRSCSARWSSTWRRAGVVRNGRVAIEKPFGHDLASARALERTLEAALPRSVVSAHRSLPRQGSVAQPRVDAPRPRLARAAVVGRARRRACR